jgi:hypothetical protein
MTSVQDNVERSLGEGGSSKETGIAGATKSLTWRTGIAGATGSSTGADDKKRLTRRVEDLSQPEIPPRSTVGEGDGDAIGKG